LFYFKLWGAVSNFRLEDFPENRTRVCSELKPVVLLRCLQILESDSPYIKPHIIIKLTTMQVGWGFTWQLCYSPHCRDRQMEDATAQPNTLYLNNFSSRSIELSDRTNDQIPRF
jgi:hypothetical protein